MDLTPETAGVEVDRRARATSTPDTTSHQASTAAATDILTGTRVAALVITKGIHLSATNES